MSREILEERELNISLIKAVIFDLDGVLVDAKEWHYVALNKALGACGQQYIITRDEHETTYDGLSTKQKLQLLTKEKGLDLNAHGKIHDNKQENTFDLIRQHCKPLNNVVAMLRDLKDAGYKLGVCSNAIRESVELMLEASDIKSYFDLILTNNDVQNKKPHSEIYDKAISHFSVLPSEVLILEDNKNGIQAAKQSGGNLLIVRDPYMLNTNFVLSRISRLEKRNNEVDLIIPAAGYGSRFVEAGYSLPKPFIDVNGKTMIETVLKNLSSQKFKINISIILLKEHYDRYSEIVKRLEKECHAKFIVIDSVTEGAASTILFARNNLSSKRPVVIANADQFIDFSFDEFLSDSEDRNLDGNILCFNETKGSRKWSFADLREDKTVARVAEKDPISGVATVGLYYFRTGAGFVDAAIDMIIKNQRTNNEFYLCPVYNNFIGFGNTVGVVIILENKMHGLGTPEDLTKFLASKKDK